MLKYVADENIDYIEKNGYACPGHNGPHGHPDTPVRNSSHLLIIYIFLYKILKDDKYLNVSKKLLKYLFECFEKSESGAIKCMETDRFDFINGLIGQAWIIESLIYAYNFFEDKEIIELATKIYKVQNYDYSKHLWNRIDISGKELGYDPTYNHQFWYAAIGCELNHIVKDKQIKKELDDFFNNTLELDFKLDHNRLVHKIDRLSGKNSVVAQIKKIIKYIIYPIRYINLNKFDYKIFENSYHLFDIYGFTIAYMYNPEYELFKSEQFKKACDYIINDIDKIDRKCGYNSFMISKKKLKFNKFYYSYNSPAFEFPLIEFIFGKKDYNKYEKILIKQYETTGLQLNKNTADVKTLQCRAYEIVRFLEKYMEENKDVE